MIIRKWYVIKRSEIFHLQPDALKAYIEMKRKELANDIAEEVLEQLLDKKLGEFMTMNKVEDDSILINFELGVDKR